MRNDRYQIQKKITSNSGYSEVIFNGNSYNGIVTCDIDFKYDMSCILENTPSHRLNLKNIEFFEIEFFEFWERIKSASDLFDQEIFRRNYSLTSKAGWLNLGIDIERKATTEGARRGIFDLTLTLEISGGTTFIINLKTDISCLNEV